MATVEITMQPTERVPEFRPGLVFEYFGRPYLLIENMPVASEHVSVVDLQWSGRSSLSRHILMQMREDESPNLRILGYADHIALTVEEV